MNETKNRSSCRARHSLGDGWERESKDKAKTHHNEHEASLEEFNPTPLKTKNLIYN
jgi:hypothetical protein